MVALGLFPNMVHSAGDPALALTIMNASSSELTLKVMLVIAIIGVPIVLAYTYWAHKTFSGKVSGEEHGY